MSRKTVKFLLVLITSNRGLCGGYNSQIIKKTIEKLKELTKGVEVDFITIGKKGDIAMRRINQNIVGAFLEIPDVNIVFRILRRSQNSSWMNTGI